LRVWIERSSFPFLNLDLLLARLSLFLRQSKVMILET
jgi:hypothetical protein